MHLNCYRCLNKINLIYKTNDKSVTFKLIQFSKRYISSTKLAVHKIILQHLRAIDHRDSTYPVARHFWEVHDSNSMLLKYRGIDAILKTIRGGDREKAQRRRESRYILKLDTNKPNGFCRGFLKSKTIYH